ncbi:MAG: rod-binding protein [Butyrivibrio sp.]|nr:rod-binding protein [Butyrivibrio sp.]
MAGYDIGGINASAYSEYAMQESRNASAEALKSKVQSTSSKSSDDELWAACKSFEAYFMEQVFKEMQKSVDALKPETTDRSTSTLVDFFKDQTLQEICANSADTQSNGFAQMLYENMKRTYNIPDAPTETDGEVTKEI